MTGEPIGELYRERIIEPLDLRGTSFSNADPSIPDPHARGYTLFHQPPSEEPLDTTDWNPSIGWSAGGIISTVEDLLVYGRALGTGEGLLPPEQQAQRLDSFLPDPVTVTPEISYGLGLEGVREWIGHSGEIPGFLTALYYHPELDAVVVVATNSDIASGDCPEDTATLTHGPQGIPCQTPVVRITAALFEALGKPFPLPPQ